MEKSNYRTRQREEVLSYLKEIHQHVTVAQLQEHFRQEHYPISTATLYRCLEYLMNTGLVRKYVVDEKAAACYEYASPEDCTTPSCFHCLCQECGKLIHLHCEELNGMKEHLEKEHGFQLNPLRTVFYGLCADCQKKEQHQ